MAHIKALQFLLNQVVWISFEGYLSLILFLEGHPGMHLSFKKQVLPEVKHHVDGIGKIQKSATGPISLIILIYAYLQDGMARSWTSPKRLDECLQALEQAEIICSDKLIDSSEISPGPGSRKVWLLGGSIVICPCKHCGLVHRNSEGQTLADGDCPLKPLQSEERAKVARLFHENPGNILHSWEDMKTEKRKWRRKKNEDEEKEDSD